MWLGVSKPLGSHRAAFLRRRIMIHRNKRRFLFPVLLLALGVTGMPTPAAAGAPDPKKISIAEARSLPLGTIVTIDGSVRPSLPERH
jgi:hypothetical protein